MILAYDVTQSLGVPFAPPAEICDRTVRRLFPWAPEHDSPWERLLWCNGRIDVPGHPRLGPYWGWCARRSTSGTGPRARISGPTTERPVRHRAVACAL